MTVLDEGCGVAATRLKVKRRLALCGLAGAALLALLAACGGGGGGGSSDSAGSGNTATALQTHLAACPNSFTLNEATPCMAGQYQGKTSDTGAECTFVYDASGVATYSASGQTVRAVLAASSSGAVFEKKAASTAAGFAIAWSVGIASGNDLDLWYQSSAQSASDKGLFIVPKKAGMPSCLVEAGPSAAASGGDSSSNLLGRSWQTPQMLNGASGAVGLLSDQPAFEAGMADDGRAFITFRQADANGRMAVQVVEGRPGAAGQAASWSAPQVLDADAPLLAGNFRPRIAVSSAGHAVVSWLTQRPCEADAVYLSSIAGQTCRYLYASRRLASESSWEAAQRVRVSPTMAAHDHYARFNAQGDLMLVFSSYDPLFGVSNLSATTLAFRRAADSGYQAFRLSGFWSNPASTTPLAQMVLADLDDAGNLFAAGQASGPFDLSQLRSTLAAALANPLGASLPYSSTKGVAAVNLRSSGNGHAAYTWFNDSGTRRSPNRLSIYSAAAQAWLAAADVTAYTQWGDTALAATDNDQGEFLLYSGCKLTVWRAGSWGSTASLPAYCGRDQSGGLYAFNRKGDYLGINWAGQPGQWGYYSYAQNKLLKGAPGSGSTAQGDFVLGTASNLFGADPSQLLLANSGLALAVTTNAFSSLPSANGAGVNGAAGARLWAVYLK